MKLIIDINKEDYEYIRENKGMHYTMTTGICEAIFEGTPLPKGHGRLIDLNDLYDFDRRKVEYAPTIIEADKGEEKTGKWVWDWSISCERPKYICSVCGETVWIKTDKCPKCKAIMKVDSK